MMLRAGRLRRVAGRRLDSAGTGRPNGVLAAVGDCSKNRHPPASVLTEVFLAGAEPDPCAFGDPVGARGGRIDVRVAGFARLEADVPQHVLSRSGRGFDAAAD